MRVVLADPPSFTPPYDHELASALARAGAEVELVTSPFRFGERPAPDGYRLSEDLYPRSSRTERASLRRLLRGLEHPRAMREVARRPGDVLHLQWLAFPELDRLLVRRRGPLVFTAHDLLPRRTAGRTRLWRALFDRFDRIVVHSERGRAALVSFGARPEALRVIPHPVFRTDMPRRDDGRTVLALGVIRPYKRLPDAIGAVLALDGARLVVAGDPRIPLDELRREAGERVEWRLGYLGRTELERALSEATVAVFPYAAELDQSGALLQALGAGVPAVVYDVGGLGEVVRRFDAGRVVPPGDVAALETALRELLDDPGALAAARAGAEEARATLTWDEAAAAHLELYGELV
ncbi:glycosyltransferase family 4 protein [Gaiella sp.]|jgi:glycosyltransferase involved in cell wall biosynthesis|uniref:glycosyltransferase family 4 protein n=1 Tax=Gaiella sp. TaxID=2663207 RepID=UPI002E2FE19D|nr:glycosyltransferase family 4 protein [Gaiella sp.]HEX5583930.1 glycosyltransferase family 4 protein [Gaiella sp.]